MSIGILNIERIILESLSVKASTLSMISSDIQIDQNIIAKVLPKLLDKNLIIKKGTVYSLNIEQLNAISNKDGYRPEAKDLINSLADLHFSSDSPKDHRVSLKLKKIEMSLAEFNELQYHLKNLESFVEKIANYRHDTPLNLPIAQHKILFWGYSDYGSLIKTELKDIVE